MKWDQPTRLSSPRPAHTRTAPSTNVGQTTIETHSLHVFLSSHNLDHFEEPPPPPSSPPLLRIEDAPAPTLDTAAGAVPLPWWLLSLEIAAPPPPCFPLPAAAPPAFSCSPTAGRGGVVDGVDDDAANGTNGGDPRPRLSAPEPPPPPPVARGGRETSGGGRDDRDCGRARGGGDDGSEEEEDGSGGAGDRRREFAPAPGSRERDSDTPSSQTLKHQERVV